MARITTQKSKKSPLDQTNKLKSKNNSLITNEHNNPHGSSSDDSNNNASSSTSKTSATTRTNILPPLDKKPPAVEVLPPPNKPPNDPKDYRVIRLTNNGTRIVLISEQTQSGVELPYISDSQSTFIGLQKDSASVAKKMERLHGSGFNCESFQFDKSTMKDDEADSNPDDPTTEDNGKVSIAVVVGSGYLDEPSADFGGLAHFCEHLVFLGSSQFPREDQFMTMIRERGGMLNACTMAESTMYYYEVKLRFLNETLDVFSSFFVDPLFRLDAIKREINAVDHEFRMKRHHDMLIRMEILKDTAKRNHPMRNFSWGNKESLAGDESPEHYEKLRNILAQFHDTHYIGPNITVAIQAAMSLDSQQEVAVRYFSKLRPGKIRPDIPKRLKNPYDTSAFNQRHLVKPVGALEYIYLTWALPREFWLNYETKPLAYLSSVISSEISGGLVDYLKRKHWIMDMCSGIQFQSRTKYGVLFVIKLVITGEGYKYQDSIIETVFGYLEALRKRGPSKVLYKDMQELRDANLAHYGNSRMPLFNVKKMASSLHLYPSKDIITGETKFYAFDQEIIEDALDQLTVDNLNVMVFSHGDEGTYFGQTESRTGSRYNSQLFSKKQLSSWGKGKLRTLFKPPSETNPYKTIEFSTLNHRGVQPKLIPLLQSPKLSVTYVPVQLKFPFAAYNVVVQSKGGRYTGMKQAMLHLLTSILLFELRQEISFAKEAGIMSSIDSGNGNLQISVHGYDKMCSKLVRDIMSKISTVSDHIDQSYFDMSKDFMLRLLHFLLIQPSNLAFNLFHRLKFWGEQSLLAMHTALVDIQFNDFIAFVSDFMKELKISMLAVGNPLEEDVQEVAKSLLQIKYNPLRDLSPFFVERRRVVQLPDNLPLNWRVESFNKSGSTSMILNYYQMTSVVSGISHIGHKILASLLVRMMSQPFFTQLRTQKSLGYQVGCALSYDNGVLGACFLVCTDAERFSVDLVNEEIDGFIQRFYDENIKDMTEEQFKEIKLKYRQYPLANFTADHTKKFYQTFLLPGGKSYKKASIQVTGHLKCENKSAEGDSTEVNCTPSFKQVMQLKTFKLPPDQTVLPNNAGFFVENIDVLHMYLNLYGR